MLKYRQRLADRPSYDMDTNEYRITLNANESTMNLPPIVEDRLMGRFASVAFNRYPGAEDYLSLTRQIAANFKVQPENILLGNGSSEIIEKLFYCFGGSKDAAIVYPQPSFSMYGIYAAAAEAKGVPVDLEPDYTLDLEKFVSAVIKNKARLCVICNPNNPTGTGFSVSDIQYIADNIPTSCAFLVDEAYVEFYGQSAMSLLKDYPNMIIARTFSKAYGLASARVGYSIASAAMTDMIGRSFMPYHMNTLSLVTADIVYQMRHEYVPRIQMVIAERKRLAEAVKQVPGFTVYPSETNFLLIHHEAAPALNEAFERQGIGVRSFGAAPRLTNCLRISMGTREENDTWLSVLKAFAEKRA